MLGKNSYKIIGDNMNLPTPITIRDHTEKVWSFNSLDTLEIFIKEQADFWSQRIGIASQNPTANQYIQRYAHFQTIFNQISAWKPQLDTWDSNTLISNLTSLIANNLSTTWLWSGHSFVEKWLELNQVSSNVADAFFEAIIQKTTSRFANGIDFFQGYLIAYEYTNQGKTEINRRFTSEKKSLSKLYDRLSEKHDELIEKVNKFENNVTVWKDQVELDFSGWFEKQVKNSDDAVLSQSKNFHEQLSSWVNKHTELENLFREKLRFDSAATYWGEKVKTFRMQGYCWGAALFLFLILGICLFSKYFLTWLNGQPSGLGLQSIEGILIFATILSSYAFLIKALSKLAFSAFHLQRDAEEREQLTHLYLSLREGANDDVESRRIILQSLFSRSESGLLMNEHGPTMPVITEYLSKVGK